MDKDKKTDKPKVNTEALKASKEVKEKALQTNQTIHKNGKDNN